MILNGIYIKKKNKTENLNKIKIGYIRKKKKRDETNRLLSMQPIVFKVGFIKLKYLHFHHFNYYMVNTK